MFTSMDLDEKLFQQAWQLTGLRTKKAVMEEALRWLVRLHEQAGVRTKETDLLDRLLGRSALAVADLSLAEVLYAMRESASPMRLRMSCFIGATLD